jgi:hypothetical protein
MMRVERWTACQAWSAEQEKARPEIAEWSRDVAHRMFLGHHDAPEPKNIVWPSVVSRERTDGAITVFEVRGFVHLPEVAKAAP